MKMKKKGILISALLLSIVIIFSSVQYIRYYTISDKTPIKIQLESVDGIKPLDDGTKQIYVQQHSERGDIIVGADGYRYKVANINAYEKIYITGNIPETFDESLSQNTFILNGEYIGKKILNGQSSDSGIKTFRVDSWEIYNNILRSDGNKSTEYLTKSDYSGSFPMKIPEKDLYDAD